MTMKLDKMVSAKAGDEKNKKPRPKKEAPKPLPITKTPELADLEKIHHIGIAGVSVTVAVNFYNERNFPFRTVGLYRDRTAQGEPVAFLPEDVTAEAFEKLHTEIEQGVADLWDKLQSRREELREQMELQRLKEERRSNGGGEPKD